MTKISEAEFVRICDGIHEDREAIVSHNPIGTPEEIVLWMLLSCLNSYLSLTDVEVPCFNGKPDAETYRNAILHILRSRRSNDFDAGPFLDKLIAP